MHEHLLQHLLSSSLCASTPSATFCFNLSVVFHFLRVTRIHLRKYGAEAICLKKRGWYMEVIKERHSSISPFPLQNRSYCETFTPEEYDTVSYCSNAIDNGNILFALIAEGCWWYW